MLIPQNRYWMKEGTQQKIKESEGKKNNRMQGVCLHVFLEISLLQEGFLCLYSSCLQSLYIFSFIFDLIFFLLESYVMEKSVICRWGAGERRVIHLQQQQPSDWGGNGESNEDKEQEKGGEVLRSKEAWGEERIIKAGWWEMRIWWRGKKATMMEVMKVT